MQVQRRIRSFVLRAGRVTPAQERALTELWPVYGIEFHADEHPNVWDLNTLFGHPGSTHRRCLEIGFGAGEVIGALALAHPDTDHLGIEVHKAGVGRVLLQAQRDGVRNLRIVCHDAVEVLRHAIEDRAFDEILIFFPDPWHKKRHRKRRLIDAEFVAMLARKLRAHGILRLATDWQDYAEQMLAVCNAEGGLRNLSDTGTYVTRPEFRSATRFERRGERLGHGVWDLAYRSAQKTAANAVDDELYGERRQNDA